MGLKINGNAVAAGYQAETISMGDVTQPINEADLLTREVNGRAIPAQKQKNVHEAVPIEPEILSMKP